MTNGKKANSNLKKYVKDFFKDLELYDDRVNGHHYEDLLQASVERFLEYENSYTAREVYENFFTIYQITGEDKSEELKVKSKKLSETNALLKLADMMKKYEDNTGELIEKQRDHFIHSVNVFVLGLAIYSQNTTYQQEFVDYILRSGYEKYYKMPGGYISHEEFLYRWGIASLFHDIGYPVEIIAKQLSKYINDGTHSISYKYDVQTALDFENFNQFNSIVKIDPHFTDVYRERYMEANYLNLYKSTNILAHQIFNDLYKEEDFRNYDEFERQSDDLYKLVNHLENFVEYMAKNNFVDHGYFSSIFVLNSYSALMQNYYYDRNCEIPEGEELNGTDEKTTDSREKYVYFFYPLLNSATAILLHNYYRGTLQNKDFGLGQLEVHQNPLAFLLILCDELQEWNRRPIGIKDKRKNHVNDIDIVVSNSEITVKYILKNAYLGLGFSEDKEKLINKLLDVEGVFNDGLDVKTTVDLDPDFKMEEVIQTESETPNILLRNVERIARSIHQNYKEKEESKDHVIKDYDDLDAKEKLSNVRQAKSYSYKLNLIGCEIVDKSDERKEHILLEFDREMKKDKNEYIKFLKSEINHEGDGSNEGSGPNRDEYDDEVELLAIIEHEEWCEEKRNTGWISHKEAFQQDLITKEEYDILNQANGEGFDNPDDNKLKDDERGIHVHANMVSWDELNSESQEKDRDPIRNMREILDDVGLKIVFTRLRLLTFKMHESYKEKYESKTNQIPPFEKLPKQTKYNNYKQTNLIVKYLAELKYELVPIDGEGAAVEKLKRKEIEYLAEREHNAWYLTKLNQGFKYGSRREGMRNPKVKPWVELSVKDKSSNKFTFEKLPENCKKVGLKIVRM